MTTRNHSHVTRGRRLGLPDTQARAAMVLAYDVYLDAIRVATQLHNAWRRMTRMHGDDDPRTKGALTKASKGAIYRAAARAAYLEAKRAAA